MDLTPPREQHAVVQQFSKCGTHHCSFGITCKLFRNAKSQAPQPNQNQRLWGWAPQPLLSQAFWVTLMLLKGETHRLSEKEKKGLWGQGDPGPLLWCLPFL